MEIEKVGGNQNVAGSSVSSFPNVSSKKFRYGGQAQPITTVASTAIASVRNNLSKSSRHQEVIEMAWAHERLQEYQSKNLDVVIERFIIHLIKSGEDHGSLIRDLHEARSKMSI
jgi:hypothetical protein